MPASEVKAILQALLDQIDALLVNQSVLAAASKTDLTRADLLDARMTAESQTKRELAQLRKKIERLP